MMYSFNFTLSVNPQGGAGSALSQLSVTFSTTQKQIGPFWCWFPGGCDCVCSRTLWVSPINSPVRLGVTPAPTTPTGFYSHRGFISPRWNAVLQSLSLSPVVPPSLSSHKCGISQSTSHHLAMSTLLLGCLSRPLLPVWMNVCCLTPWLSDFHRTQFSGSSG